jgi:phosphonate metabolism protein PhnN/1,5-bisphosphokinase (PRPP-forming)
VAQAPGTLILVVGPSGVGKDTLIAAAKSQLVDTGRYHFPRRMVTRKTVVALEDHDSTSPAEFGALRHSGAFALSWDAHGLSYGVPVGIDAELAAGRSVVVNVSRKIIGAAQAKYPRCAVILIDASPEIRAARLAGRGRETENEVLERLRREGAALPDGISVTRIDNSGPLAEGIAAFISALSRIAG